MTFKRYMLLIFCLYISAMLYGAAFDSDDIVCLIGSSIWLFISIMFLWKPFKHKQVEETGGSE